MRERQHTIRAPPDGDGFRGAVSGDQTFREVQRGLGIGTHPPRGLGHEQFGFFVEPRGVEEVELREDFDHPHVAATRGG